MKQPARLTLTLQREDKPLPFGILSYYRRHKLISLALFLAVKSDLNLGANSAKLFLLKP